MAVNVSHFLLASEQEFPGHGEFVGRVTSYDGHLYKVYYDEDGDEEEMTEKDLNELEILDTDEAESDDGTPRLVSQKYPVGTRFLKVRVVLLVKTINLLFYLTQSWVWCLW